MVPALLMNLYITGLNQITDVEIDKVNKPDLVIPAGDLRLRDASFIVVVAGLLGCLGGFGRTSSGGLRLVLWGSAVRFTRENTTITQWKYVIVSLLKIQHTQFMPSIIL